MVYGLGGGLVYSCGAKGKWKTVLPKLLQSVDNDYLISTVDMSQVATKEIYKCVGQDRLYLDSGGFSLFKYQKKRDEAIAALDVNDPDYETRKQEHEAKFAKECDRMKRKFETMLQIGKYKEIFELDNEYFRAEEDMLSPKNYCRELVMKYQGFYPTPVFKMHQGFQYWKDLCESPLYPKLSIGGLAQTRDWKLYRPELVKMMKYARDCGKKVHLLGCQNVETFKMVRPDTVDYSIFQYAINLAHAKAEHPELTTYEDLKIHAVLYAFARAKSRSFLYDTMIPTDTIDPADQKTDDTMVPTDDEEDIQEEIKEEAKEDIQKEPTESLTDILKQW